MFVDIIKTDWLEVLDVILRSILSLVTLFLVTKMLGKKQVSQLSLFDYVIGISIGNFAAEMTINTESQYMNGIVSVVMFGLVAYVVSIVTMKSIVLRRYFMGVPTILIQKGKILEKNIGKKAIIQKLPMQPGDVNKTVCDYSKAHKLLNYTPKTTFEEGIRKFIEWRRGL